MTVEKQVAIIYLGSKGLLSKVPLDKVQDFQENFLTTLENKFPEVLDTFRAGKLTDEATGAVTKLAAELAGQYA